MTIIEQARKIRADMTAVTATLTDEQGLELITLFEPWRTDIAYAGGGGRKRERAVVQYTMPPGKSEARTEIPTSAAKLIRIAVKRVGILLRHPPCGRNITGQPM